jgi:hypothetical protein
MNIKEYWKSVRKVAADLDPEAAQLDATEQDPALRTNLDLSQKEMWLVSIRNEQIGTLAGRVVSAHPMNAARLIKELTHVLASPEQVQKHKAELATRRDQILAEERERKGQQAPPQIVISSELVAAAAAGNAGKQSRLPRADHQS